MNQAVRTAAALLIFNFFCSAPANAAEGGIRARLRSASNACINALTRRVPPAPPFTNFAYDRQAVSDLLSEQAAALGMTASGRRKLLALVDAPEMRDLFKPMHAPALFKIEPHELTYAHVADAIAREYAIKAMAELKLGWPHRAFSWSKDQLYNVRKTLGIILVSTFIAAGFTNHVSRLADAVTGTRMAEPVNEGVAAIWSTAGEGPVLAGAPGLSESFTDAWEASNTIPLNQHLGRDYYVFSEMYLEGIRTNLAQARENRPSEDASAEDWASWRQDVLVERGRLLRMPFLYGDVFRTDLGRNTIAPEVERLLEDARRYLNETSIHAAEGEPSEMDDMAPLARTRESSAR